MNKLVFCASVSIALFFAACGDSSDAVGSQKPSNADMEVRTYSELPSCAEKRDGKTAYVADQEQGYVCSNGKWVENDSVKVVNYPLSWSRAIGSITDSRDGQTYKTVTIGSQTWMAENLNYETSNSCCYHDTAKYCAKYGRLYMWTAAISACPLGWHLPTYIEFGTLFTAVGGYFSAGSKLKSTSGWSGNGNGLDDYAFSALPGGQRYLSGFSYGGEHAYFWSSTEDNDEEGRNAFRMYLSNKRDDAVMGRDYKSYLFSVRCVKDE